MKRIKKHYRKMASRLRGVDYKELPKLESTTHLDLIEEIKDDYLPCLFFTLVGEKWKLMQWS